MPRPPERPCQPEYVMLPGALLWAGLSGRAVALWGVIDGHQRDNGEAWPSQHHLADDLGCSPRSIDRAAAELAAAGWLTVHRERGRGKTNTYAVIGSPRKTGAGADFSPQKTGAGDFRAGKPARAPSKTGTGADRTRDSEQENALQGRPGALAAAVLAVLPDRLAGQVTRSTLERHCGELPAGWTPETIGRAAAAASWPPDSTGGLVIGWVRALGAPPPARPVSKPTPGPKCPDGYPYAADGSCGCGKHERGEA